MRNYNVAAIFLISVAAFTTGNSYAESLLVQDFPGVPNEAIEKMKQELGEENIRKLESRQSEVWTIQEDMDIGALIQSLKDQGLGVSNPLKDYTNVFQPTRPELDMQPAEAELLEKIKNSVPEDRVKVYEISPQELTSFSMSVGFDRRDGLDKGSSIKLPLGDEDVVVQQKSITESDAGSVWRGTFGEGGEVLLIVNENQLRGTATIGKEIYSIRPIGSKLHTVIRKETKDYPEEHSPRFKEKLNETRDYPPPGDARDLPPGAADDKISEIGLVVGYTKQASENYVDIKKDLIDVALVELQESLENSDLKSVRFKLNHAYEVEYLESNSWDDHLDHMSKVNDGVMDEIPEKRANNDGDIYLLIIEDGAYCGEALEIAATKTSAMAIVSHGCATGYYSFAHEAAHLFGARHDYCSDSVSSPYAYGHGFLNGDVNRTIMGYGQCCGNCSRIKYWSNPNVLLDGKKMGSESRENNARVLNVASRRLKNFYN